MPTAQTDHEELTPAEAAVKARRSEYTILAWIRSGLLPARRVRSRLVIDPADLARVMAGTPARPPTPTDDPEGD